MKKSLLMVALFPLLIVQSVHAAGEAISPRDMCSSFQGEWKGTGTLRTSVGPLTMECRYSGKGVIVQTSLPSTFIMNNEVDLRSGQCPEHVKFSLPGTCVNGNIQFSTGEVKLNGKLGADGHSADLAGKVTVPLYDNPVEAVVDDIHLTKL